MASFKDFLHQAAEREDLRKMVSSEFKERYRQHTATRGAGQFPRITAFNQEYGLTSPDSRNDISGKWTGSVTRMWEVLKKHQPRKVTSTITNIRELEHMIYTKGGTQIKWVDADLQLVTLFSHALSRDIEGTSSNLVVRGTFKYNDRVFPVEYINYVGSTRQSGQRQMRFGSAPKVIWSGSDLGWNDFITREGLN